MTLDGLLALLPLIAVAAASIVVMLVIALRRDYQLAFFLALAGLLLALSVLPVSLHRVPCQVTGLILIDTYAVYFSALILVSALIVVLLSRGYFLDPKTQNEEFFVLLLTAALGGMILVSSSHFASFFLGLEILSVSLFPMIAYEVKCKPGLEAGVKYLMLSGVSSALLLFGMALVYGESGVLSFQQLGLGAVASLAVDPLLLVGTVMMVAALGFKLSLVPFHLWTADVYQGAPAPVTAFVATVSKAAVFALLLRFWISSQAYRSAPMLDILIPIAVLSVLAGNLLALLQTQLKRMLAYSSIAHMGYLLVALVAGSILQKELLAESMGFYLLAYAISNLGAIGVVSALSNDEREWESLADYSGLFWRDPWMAGIMTVNLLSLAGIPLTIGFIGKFYIFAASVDAQLWSLVATVVVGSGVGLYYYLRVVLVMLDRADDRIHPATASAPPLARLTLAVLALLLLWSGIFPQPLMQALMAAAKTLS